MNKIITLNINGLRSGLRKGLAEWLALQAADILCLQEIKVQSHDWQALCQAYFPSFYPAAAFAEKKGYSGVAILSQKPPWAIHYWPNPKSFFFKEGRFVAATFADFQVASVYLPSGTSGEARQRLKYQLLAEFSAFTSSLSFEKPWVITGDFNIAHTPLDLKNWRANQKNSGFLPEERAWLSAWCASGWSDVFRTLYPEVPGYTWWTYRGQAFTNDVGWRLDYQWLHQTGQSCFHKAEVIKNPRFSDHAALCVDYNFAKASARLA